VLLIAEAANPEWVSVPLVGWSLATSVAEVADAHIVTQVRNREAFVRAGLIEGREFTAIDSERVAAPLWRMASVLRGGAGVGWTTTTAIQAFSYYYFEHLFWKRFGNAIQSGDWDLVHRVTPLSPTTPSLIAAKCSAAKVPFVVGPLNGGVPWPPGFDAARRQEREWLSYVRDAYKLLPGYRSTLKSSSALLIGSKDTLAGIPTEYHAKCIYLPENAISPGRFSREAEPYRSGPLHGCFVGRLVPYKGPDMLLEAAAPLMREGRLFLDILGDGPLLPQLQEFARRERLSDAVTFHGWVEHTALQERMCRSQIFTFPSIREFGGGAVLEAMALGIVPVIVDYAGPAELVTAETGFKIPMGKRDAIVQCLRDRLQRLVADPSGLQAMSLAARSRVSELFTWTRKARQVAEVYQWVLGERREKPQFFG
jgi:glycosyltransferase involved in cell wall biosynthesis